MRLGLDRGLGASDPSLEGACEQIAAACSIVSGHKWEGTSCAGHGTTVSAVYKATLRRTYALKGCTAGMSGPRSAANGVRIKLDPAA